MFATDFEHFDSKKRNNQKQEFKQQMYKNLKDENCVNVDKAKKDTSFSTATANASATMRSEEDNNGIDHRIVLFGWRLRLASGKDIFTECFENCGYQQFYIKCESIRK